MLSIWQRNAQLWIYWLVLSNKPLFPRAWGSVTLKSIWLSLPTMFLYRLGNHRLIIMMLKIRWMLHTPRERKPQLPLGFFTLSTCEYIMWKFEYWLWKIPLEIQANRHWHTLIFFRNPLPYSNRISPCLTEFGPLPWQAKQTVSVLCQLQPA